MFGGLAHNMKTAVPPDNLAVSANRFYRSPDFHVCCLTRTQREFKKKVAANIWSGSGARALLVRRLRYSPFGLVSVHDPAFCKVVGGHFNLDLIAGKQSDAIHPHFAGKMAEDGLAVLKLYPEARRRKTFFNYAVQLDKTL